MPKSYRPTFARRWRPDCVSFVPRRDGLVFQAVGEDDYYGFNDGTTNPNQAEADFAVNTIAKLFSDA